MATANSDASTTRGIRRQQLRLTALGSRHRADHRLNPFELLLPLLEHAVIQLVHSRDHLHQPTERTHALDQSHLMNKVCEIERRLLQLSLHLLHVSKFNLLLSLLHQSEHIPHAENAACHPLGMKRLQGLNLLASTDEFDRLPTHLADR